MSALRTAAGVLLALHGIAHLPGFLAAWQLSRNPGLVYKTTVLSGRVDLGAAGIRVLGSFWLLTSLGFLYSALSTATNRPHWLAGAAIVTITSFALSVINWPDSRVGVAINLFILMALAVASDSTWR